jgi:rhomboid family GlyGly-CTERM serine protease
MIANQPLDGHDPPVTLRSLLSRDGMMLGLVKSFRVTFLVSLVTLLVGFFPSGSLLLEMDFASVVDGQWWRLLTGHVTHFGAQHLFWDLLMFVVLSSLCESQHQKHYAPLLLMVSLVVSATVMFACDDVISYRGLSGVDTGLFVWFVGDQFRISRKAADKGFAIFWGSLGIALIGKLCFEAITGDLLFVHVDGFKPLVESHVSGGVAGGIALGFTGLCHGDTCDSGDGNLSSGNQLSGNQLIGNQESLAS